MNLPPAVTAVVTAPRAVTPGAGSGSGSARIVLVRVFPGEQLVGPLNQRPAGHLIMTLSGGPSVERMVSRHGISAGSPHRTAPPGSR